jgi:lysosomal alpha-glucosidase
MDPSNSFKDKSPSVKYHKINTIFVPLNTDEDLKKETKYGKCLRWTVKCSEVLLVLVCFLAVMGIFLHLAISTIWTNDEVKLSSGQADQCTNVEDDRFDCFPERDGATQEVCLSRGCCWAAATKAGTAPWCFFPSNYNGYNATNVTYTTTGITANIQRSTSSFYPRDVKNLSLFVEYQTSTRLRVRIYDPTNPRFEVPLITPSGSLDLSNPLYTVSIQQSPFNIVVKRNSTGAVVFDTTSTAPLIFTDQYLQIATQLSTKYLYGFGEHRGTFLQDLNWRRLVFWNRDDVPKVDNNGYGSHPFFLNLETGGQFSNSNAHGVFLLNSNGGEVAIQPFGAGGTGAITYRMLGGILDFYILLGLSPLSVVQQYSEVVGRPYFPPFWSLGFHICKYGIQNATDLRNMINRNRQAQIPYDVQWGDIDYMDGYKDWTYNNNTYNGLPAIVQNLHDNNQRYIIMADPAISSGQPIGAYPPFDDGVEMDIFVKNDSGAILYGQVWPGNTAFPDFFHPRAVDYWYKQAQRFHGQIPFDGLWIDMNEPSNFVDGSTLGCTNNQLDNPPFVPATIDGGKLESKTLCPSAKHAISTHYNLHNMYGWSQANVTRSTLDLLYGNKRSTIITRSTFPGSGKNVGHWLGDNFSTFSDLYYSIPGILNFNLFAITQIGVDICGFNGVTTPELCTRWHQLGIFYPFMRNHDSDGSPVQDPGSFQSPWRDYMRSALQTRYRLLAVLYTAFYKAHTQGLPIVRPLFFLYPGTEAIDRQFMWTDQLLVSPVLDQGATSVQALIPDDIWYDFYTGALQHQRGRNVTLSSPIDYISIHVRGGSILPLLPATQRTDLSRLEKFELLVAVGGDGSASGELFWDDGESIDSLTANNYSDILFSLTNANNLVSTIPKAGYEPAQGVKLGSVTFYGIKQAPTGVTVNGVTIPFIFDASLQVLSVSELDVNLLQPLSVKLITRVHRA